MLALHFGPVSAGAEPPAQVLDGGTFHLAVVPARNWTPDPKPAQGCILFQYTDQPALTIAATIGVFRIVVPAVARAGDRAELAAAYATYDLSGAQQALFKTSVKFVPLGKTTKSLNGGQLFSFGDRLDADYLRLESTRFLRAWIFFPSNFAQDGALFLVLGKEESNFMEVRPSELERAEEIISGIRER